MVHYEDGGRHNSQENQVGYNGGGGTIIFIAWIRFVAFEKHFSFVSLVVMSDSG